MLEQQRKEIGQLQGKMKKKVRRQKALKDLAGRILQQRSEVEQFFLEALEQIKEEIRKKLLLEKKRNFTAAQNERPKPLTADQSRQSAERSYQDKVDLNDLDWEDRERVLRLLFSKMNAGVPPKTHHLMSNAVVLS